MDKRIGLKWLDGFLMWRLKHIDDRQFLLLMSLVVGFFCSIAALILKTLVYYVHYFISNGFVFGSSNYLYLALPLVGIALTTILIRYFIKDDLSHGISKILYAISKGKGDLKSHHTYSSMLTSSLTVGFGGSVGLEAPIVLTGSSIGSNLSRIFRLNFKYKLVLIGCGAAGAVAGIFKAPVAGVVFAIEVLVLDLTMANLIPLLIAAATSASVSYLIAGEGVVFSFSQIQPFNLANLPLYAVLGLLCGFISLYFIRMNLLTEDLLKKITHPVKKMILAGSLLGVLIFVFPSLYGEGYNALIFLLGGEGDKVISSGLFTGDNQWPWMVVILALLIVLTKVIAMALTNGAGGIGGVFAPSLFVGGVTGFMFARSVNLIFEKKIPESNFALVGMCGIMAGVMHAPLTGIFLIAEVTGGYELFIPLMVTATISYLTANYYEPFSVYAKRLAEKGEMPRRNKDLALLSMLNLNKMIEKDFVIVNPDQTLRDLTNAITVSQRNIFPVVDDRGLFIGMVRMDDIRDIIFKSELYDVLKVRDLMVKPDITIEHDESMEKIAQKFNISGKYNIAVLKEGQYLGFLSRVKLFSTYRNLLRDFSDE